MVRGGVCARRSRGPFGKVHIVGPYFTALYGALNEAYVIKTRLFLNRCACVNGLLCIVWVVLLLLVFGLLCFVCLHPRPPPVPNHHPTTDRGGSRDPPNFAAAPLHVSATIKQLPNHVHF